jgi:hypothetical protein
MALLTLQIPPGVYKNGTDYQTKGRWNESSLVRWFENTIRPVGGWRKRSDNAVSGKARGFLVWRDNSGERWIAIGTHSGLFIMNQAGTIYNITPSGFTTGDADAEASIGYGYGPYGSFSYGVARPDLGGVIPATTWSLDTWGEYLVGCSSSDGKLYEWTLGTSADAVQIANSPEDCVGLISTDERILFALGADGNPRKIAWSDQEDNTDWTPTALSQAGDIELTTSGTIQCAKRIRGSILIFTDVDVHLSTYIGPPFIYSFERAGTGCGVISKQAVAVNDSACVWMSRSGFWVYDGFVKPLPCDVGDYVYTNLNMQQASKIYCVHNSSFGEVWWFYPSAESTENDSYVSYNYRENHWAIGKIDRTCGTDRGVFANPLWVSSAGYIYEHEVGLNYESSPVFAESGPIEIGDGERVFSMTGLIPDEKTAGDVRARFGTKFYPNSTEYNYGPYTLNSPTSVRISGRQLAVRIEAVNNTDWRVGNIRLEGKAGGLR